MNLSIIEEANQFYVLEAVFTKLGQGSHKKQSNQNLVKTGREDSSGGSPGITLDINRNGNNDELLDALVYSTWAFRQLSEYDYSELFSDADPGL